MAALSDAPLPTSSEMSSGDDSAGAASQLNRAATLSRGGDISAALRTLGLGSPGGGAKSPEEESELGWYGKKSINKTRVEFAIPAL